MVQDLFKHFLQVNNTKQAPPPPMPLVETENENRIQAQHSVEHETLNVELLNQLKTILPEFKFKTYFENNLTISKIEEDTVYFQIKTSFIKKVVEAHNEEISNTLHLILGRKFNLLFEAIDSVVTTNEMKPKNVNENKFTLDLSPTRDDLSAKIQTQYIEHMSPNKNSIIIDKEKTFKNFIFW
jgi:hypothetical protein